ncbi:MAG: TlpA family protein disulfide reductase [Chitinophagia bacterium]|nr:TlpA family protein disulfide reductase [Chitinophagia bacterium]
MKSWLPIVTVLLACLSGHGQQQFPSVRLRDMDGRTVDFADLAARGRDTALVISFWATWCVPCIAELDNITDDLADRSPDTPFRLVGVSIDDTRTSHRVKPFVRGKGWDFDILMDTNSELKRALNITDVPHMMVIRSGRVIYRRTGYSAGAEEELFNALRSR